MRVPLRVNPHHPLRKVLAAIIIAALAASLVFALHKTPGVRNNLSELDDTLYNSFYKLRTPEDRTGGSIVIVTVDDSSVEQLAKSKSHLKWPYPRTIWGDAALYVESQHARAVAFDIKFEGPSGYDEDFADQLDSVKMPLIIGTKVNDDGTLFIFAPKPKRPPAFGALNVINDDMIREYIPVVHGFPSLALQTVQKVGVTPPPWAGTPFRLHYYGPNQRQVGNETKHTYRYIPVWAVITALQNPKKAASLGLTPDTFAGKIVLFGYTAAGTYDLKSSPLSPQYPGVEAQATAIDNLLNGQYVHILPPAPATCITFLGCFLASMGVIFPRRAVIKVLLAAIAAVLLIGTAVLMFRSHEIHWLPMASPLLALVMGTVGAFAWSYLAEDRQRRFVLKALSQYVSPEVASEIERDPSAFKLGGRRRDMTVMFSDIQGFTDLSESMDSEKLSAMLNFYLGEMSSLILNNKGTLDKYIGDAIMSFWNAPVVQNDHAALACRAALAMRDREAQIQPELAAFGAKGMLTRIGINTGPMVFGNMGSAQKFNYSVLGDSVNLGSRLEGANKFYGSRILISETTAAEVKGRFVLRQLNVLRVKGKLKPLAVYELLAEGEAGADLAERVRQYEIALAHYRAQRWEDAEAILADLHQKFPDDPPVSALRSRIEKLHHNPPEENWDGVFVAKDK